MDDTGLPQSDELPELSALSNQDIPEAVREGAVPSQATSAKRHPLLLGIGGLSIAALIVVPAIVMLRSQLVAVSDTSGQVESPTPAATPQSSPTGLLGHLAYAEAPANQLEIASPGSGISLQKAAAKKFREMTAAAAADGVDLVLLSGFRSFSDQDSLFFGVKAERGEATAKRAEVSAPPGYSEHHTGYAVDLGDGEHPGADLQFDFEETEAFKWLKENAAYYSFEMSFPKGNPMGVSYEPWHWRFVGDRASLETFYQAKESARKAPISNSSRESSPAETDAANQ